jgi:hypothetical protein
MKNVMDCEDIRRDGLAERYLRRDLTDVERDAYERHYFSCNACLEELETLEGLREAFRQAKTPGRGIPAWAWVLAATLVLTVGIRWVWTFRQPPPAQTVQSPTPVLPAPAKPSLLALSQFAPPAYSSVVMRGAESDSARSFRHAMDLYQHGEFARAANALRQAAALDPEDPAARFYLGVSELLSGHTDGGLRALRATVRMGETNFLDPARFYLAKGLLRAGDPAAARIQLEAVAGSRHPLRDDARQLLDKLTP